MNHEIKIPEKLNNQAPFVIRAHHLAVYGDLVQQYSQPGHGHWGKDGTIHYEKGYPSSPMEAAKRIVKANASGDPEYSQDVLGPDLAGAGKVEDQLQKTFQKFLSLPDNYPVEIVEGKPDEICKTCIVGKHCKTSPESEIQQRTIFGRIRAFFYYFRFPHAEDTEYVNKFTKAAKSLKLLKPTVIEEEVLYTNAERPKRVRRIKTTMDITKNVISRSKIFD